MKNTSFYSRGITLVSLVITIIVLLILAGITIAQLTGNGLFGKTKQAKQEHLQAEMREDFNLALSELQAEKKGEATLDDITQEWIDGKLKKYKNIIIEDEKTKAKQIIIEKDGVIVTCVLDKSMELTENTIVSNKFNIQVTEPIVSTSITATKSDANGQLTKGTAAYISFSASIDIEGGTCIIHKEVPYKIYANGTYSFIVIGIYEGQVVTKEVIVNVTQYQVPAGYVQYDAGEWTKEEIAELENNSLYSVNSSKAVNSNFKLKNSTGLNFTFGGFTYKKNITNFEEINSATLITSRNQSVSNSTGKPKYDGWQIAETKTKTDEAGNTVKNNDGTDRVYVTKIVHAGTPENFVFAYTTSGDAHRAEYILSSGQRQTSYSKLSDKTTTINTRNWNMYKDKELEEKGYIKEVHAMTYSEAGTFRSKININIGLNYWLATAHASNMHMYYVKTNDGSYTSGTSGCCYGVRPVVEMNDGVYIQSGNGTAVSPYVLGKE